MDEKVTTSGIVIRGPVELYHQNCVMKATIMENARNKKNLRRIIRRGCKDLRIRKRKQKRKRLR